MFTKFRIEIDPRYDYLSGFGRTPTRTPGTTTRRRILGGLQDEPQCFPPVEWQGGTLLAALLEIQSSIIVLGEDSAMVWLLTLLILLKDGC